MNAHVTAKNIKCVDAQMFHFNQFTTNVLGNQKCKTVPIILNGKIANINIVNLTT